MLFASFHLPTQTNDRAPNLSAGVAESPERSYYFRSREQEVRLTEGHGSQG